MMQALATQLLKNMECVPEDKSLLNTQSHGP